MAFSQKDISALMCELSVALAELADKMSNLAIDLENQYLDAERDNMGVWMEAARSIIGKAKDD